MKSTLFVLALVQALIAMRIFRSSTGARGVRWTALARHVGTAFAGVAILPALTCLYFFSRHAIDDLFYGLIGHNLLPDSANHALGLTALMRWAMGIAVVAAVGWIATRADMAEKKKAPLALLFFANCFYLISLLAFWPVITMEDHLPWLPGSMLICAPFFFWLASAAVPRLSPYLGSILAAAELLWIFAIALPWQDDTRDKVGMVADALKLTAPEEFVMDSKGETIYRRRPFHYVLESRTFQRLHRKLIIDDIADSLVRTRTPLATLKRMPPHARAFIRENYIPIAYRLRVAGKVVRDHAVSVNDRCSFEVAVPQRYALVTPAGAAEGTLDDILLSGPRELESGTHLFIPSQSSGELVLIWAHALECGYSPFAEIKRSINTAQD
jgi:hypothetical protein